MDSVWADPARHAGLTGARQAQKKMFGGLAVLLDGTMAVGVYGDDLLVRTDPGQQDMLLAEPGTRPFDMTGRPMKGWIVVDASMCSAGFAPHGRSAVRLALPGRLGDSRKTRSRLREILDRMVDDTARDRAIYHALKAVDEVAASLQAHLFEEHGADPERAAAQSTFTNSLKLLRQARERLGEGLRAVGADSIAESDEISLRNH